MRIKYIDNLSAVLITNEGATCNGTFSPTKITFSFGGDFWWMNNRYFVADASSGAKLLEDGSILIPYRYKGKKELETTIKLENDKSLTIEDEFVQYNGKEEKITRFNVIMNLHYEELEIEDGNLSLLVHEEADDSWGETYITGKKEYTVPLKVGEIINAQLFKKQKLRIKISDIENDKITLECMDYFHRSTYPMTEIHKIIINPLMLAHLSESGGFNTRYDYESWNWWMEIKLNIKGAVMFKGEWE